MSKLLKGLAALMVGCSAALAAESTNPIVIAPWPDHYKALEALLSNDLVKIDPVIMPHTAVAFVDFAGDTALAVSYMEETGVEAVYFLPAPGALAAHLGLPGNLAIDPTRTIEGGLYIVTLTIDGKATKVALLTGGLRWIAAMERELDTIDRAIAIGGRLDYKYIPWPLTQMGQERKRLRRLIEERGLRDPEALAAWVDYHRKLKDALDRRRAFKQRKAKPTRRSTLDKRSAQPGAN